MEDFFGLGWGQGDKGKDKGAGPGSGVFGGIVEGVGSLLGIASEPAAASNAAPAEQRGNHASPALPHMDSWKRMRGVKDGEEAEEGGVVRLGGGDYLVSLGMIDTEAVNDGEVAELVSRSLEAGEKLRCSFRRPPPSKAAKGAAYSLWVVGKGQQKDPDGDHEEWEESGMRSKDGKVLYMRWSDRPERESRIGPVGGGGEFV